MVRCAIPFIVLLATTVVQSGPVLGPKAGHVQFPDNG